MRENVLPYCIDLHFLRTIFNLHHVPALFLLLSSTLSYSCKSRPGVWPLSFRFWFSFSVIDLQGLTEIAVYKIYFWSFLYVRPWFGQRWYHWTQLCTISSRANSAAIYIHGERRQYLKLFVYITLLHYFKPRIKSNNKDISHASHTQKNIFLDCTTNAHARFYFSYLHTVFILYAVGL